ncbi:MAG: DNA mismatch repair protein MutS, partial [Phascolarctobacterium sp.]|nr:DNA mismatch repair protein MutS [Candidatus Phascolarctobacterium equi]
MSQLTPMVEQYNEIKSQHQDELLFFRLGDFYEMFNQDALIASRELNLTLTKRSNSNGDMPMCGVPYHAVEGYIAKLVKKGYRIAICEQTEDPKKAEGTVVKWDIIRIITPGTALNEQVLEDGQHRYLALLLEKGEEICLAAADVSTGDCLWFGAKGKERLGLLSEQLYKLQPAEVVLGGQIENWEEFGQWLKNKIPECVVVPHFEPDGKDY